MAIQISSTSEAATCIRETEPSSFLVPQLVMNKLQKCPEHKQKLAGQVHPDWS